MTNEPKRRGPKPKGQPRRKVIAFGVSPEHHDWLLKLANRSAWLAEQIEKLKHTDSDTKPVDDPDTDKSTAS